MRILTPLLALIAVGLLLFHRPVEARQIDGPPSGGPINTFRSLSDSTAAPDDQEIRRKLEQMTHQLGLDEEGRPTGSAEKEAAVSPGANGTAPRKLRITPVGDRQPSLDETIANLRKLVRDNAPAEAIAAFEQSAEYQSAKACSANAVAAMLMKRDIAAVAALLRARELEPANLEHTLNLAGVVSGLGLPRHALALIDSVEKSRRAFAAAAGLNPRAVLLNNRGNALLRTKRFAEAEKVLREVIRLEPGLREPYLNLAHAIYQQRDTTKVDEAIRFYRVSFRPVPPKLPPVPGSSTPEPSATPPAPTAEETADPEQKAADLQAQRRGRPSPYDVFDMSRGKSGGLPTIKIPRTITDGKAMLPKVEILLRELSAKSRTIGLKMNELDTVMRERERSGQMPQISARRARDVFWYITHLEINPRLRSLLNAVKRSAADPGVGTHGGQMENPWASRELRDEQDRITASGMLREPRAEAMWNATEPFHSSWQGPIRQLESDLNRLAHEAHPYMTAIAANLSDPVHREYAKLLVEHRMTLWGLQLAQTLRPVCRYDDRFVSAWGARRGEGSAEDPTPGHTADASSCPSFLSGEFTVSASVKFVEVSLNCEKVGLEFSAGAWVKAFLEVEHNFTGEISVFVGGAVEASTGLEVGPSLGMKSGFYVSFDKDGNFTSFGTKQTESAGFSLGPVGYEREIENSFAIIVAPKP